MNININQINPDNLAWESIAPEDIRGKGWIYKDVPQMDIIYHDVFTKTIGPENIRVVAETHYTLPNGQLVAKSGQYFISPEGVKNAQEYAEKNRKDS